MTQQLQGMFSNLGGSRTRSRRMKVREALKLLTEEEAAKLVNEEELKVQALRNAEQNGIVFLDEIDKIARRQDAAGADVSREGVQRDLLPLVEGCTVNTKYGMVKTDHILFIASGAFHMSKPSDLIPELQGRLPIRVELDALKVEDFVRILTEPDASLLHAVRRAARHRGRRTRLRRRAACAASPRWPSQVNQRTENIGARRLHTVMERLLETLSASRRPIAPARGSSSTQAYVDAHLGELARDEDLAAVHPVTPHRAGSGEPQPTEIKLRKQSRVLEVSFDDGSRFELPFEYLRVLLTFRRSARARSRPGDAAARQARGRHPRGRSRRQLRGATGVRRRPRHRPLHLGLPVRTRHDPRGEMAALPRPARGARHRLPDAGPGQEALKGVPGRPGRVEWRFP